MARYAVTEACCTDAGTCPGCGVPLCEWHSQDLVRCESSGDLVCRTCHSACASVRCARENQ